MEQRKRANILVLGTSGAGKSTLINTVMGKEVAKVGSGGHVTEKMEVYESEELNFRLIDSRGFEYSLWGTHKGVKDMKAWIREGLKEDKPCIHMLWLCVDATSHRFTRQTIKTMQQVKKAWKEVPIIVVLTKSFFETEDADNIEMVKSTFWRFAKKREMPIAIIPVLAVAPKGAEVPPRGIEELISVTMDNMDDAVKAADDAIVKFDLRMRDYKAQAAILAATTSATIVGAVPLAFPDAAILTPLEVKMIDSIEGFYELDKNDARTKDITRRIIEAGAASLAAKIIINKLKLVPGVVNLAADALNAIVAGVMVFGIGQATMVIMHKVYQGDIDMKDLSWINDTVDSMTGKLLKKVTKELEQSGGKIKASDLISILKKD